MPGCKTLAVRIAVANFYGFLLDATHSHHRGSEFLKNGVVCAAPRLNSDSQAFSAKLVHSCEITGNFHRCKIYFEFCVTERYGSNASKSLFTAETPRFDEGQQMLGYGSIAITPTMYGTCSSRLVSCGFSSSTLPEHRHLFSRLAHSCRRVGPVHHDADLKSSTPPRFRFRGSWL